MPSKSPKQRRFFFAKFGKRWTKAHHMDKVSKGKKKK